jgi:ribonuclease HII
MDRPAPTLELERRLWAAGCRSVAGIDEAGRGALAGPVTAAAVVVSPARCDDAVWSAVRDSKLLAPGRRAELAPAIEAAALAWGVGWSSAAEIDRIGIAAATRQAMLAAIAALAVRPDYLLIDWVKLPAAGIPQHSQPKADRAIVSVAAASILAKVHRDRHMVALAADYPVYGFAGHKGYGAAAHLAAIHTHGPCAAHRCTFAPLAALPLFAVEAAG